MLITLVRRLAPSCAAALVSLAVALHRIDAQTPTVPTPDTLGANFNADSVGKGTPHDYDFLEGHWNIRFQSRRPTGEFSGVTLGTWSGTKSHGGRVLEDEFSLTSPGDGSHSLTMTYRVFSPVSGTWQMAGISVSGGSPWATGQTWSDATHRYAVQDYGPMRVRIKYYDITPNHFLWRADATRDGGKTWILDYWRMEATRVGP